MSRLLLRLVVLCVLVPLWAVAQTQPPSWRIGRQRDIPVETLPAINGNQLMAEDAAREQQVGNAIPLRYGVMQQVRIGSADGGVWTDLPTGGRVWQGRVRTPGVVAQQPVFEQLDLAPGTELYLYTPDRRWVRGPFTAADAASGVLSVYPLEGDELVVEYHQPAGVTGGSVSLSGVVGVFRPLSSVSAKAFGFGRAGSCHTNMLCPSACNWQDQKRGVVLMLMNGFLCSGSLINNTAQNRRPYILSGNHCFEPAPGTPATWLYVFNYESLQCDANVEGVTNQTVTGSTLRARFQPSDLLLLELNQPVPTIYNPYWVGWDRRDNAPMTSVSIHHPRGDLKKIAFDDQPATSTTTTIGGATSGTNALWRVAFDRNTATEGGSSGSPLFDQNQRVIGTLWGGASDCIGSTGNGLADFYGKVSVGWDGGGTPGTRLRDWLDPLNTGTPTLDGSFLGTFTGTPIQPPPTISLTAARQLETTAPAQSFQWLFTGTLPGSGTVVSNQPIEGAIGATFRPVIDGVYTLRIVSLNGCELTSAGLAVTGTINQPHILQQGRIVRRNVPSVLAVYPNPVVLETADVELAIDSPVPAAAQMVAMDGRVVQEFLLTRLGGSHIARLNTTDLASGIYVLLVRQGSNDYVTRVLVRK